MQIFKDLSIRLKRFTRWILSQAGTPGERARGIAIGVFMGCFPLFGLQSVLGMILASLFKGNQLLAATATWISNPFTYIPLYWINYQVGSILLGDNNSFKNIDIDTFSTLFSQGYVVLNKILLGSLFVGLFLGLIFGCLTYFLLVSLINRNHYKS